MKRASTGQTCSSSQAAVLKFVSAQFVPVPVSAGGHTTHPNANPCSLTTHSFTHSLLFTLTHASCIRACVRATGLCGRWHLCTHVARRYLVWRVLHAGHGPAPIMQRQGTDEVRNILAVKQRPDDAVQTVSSGKAMSLFTRLVCLRVCVGAVRSHCACVATRTHTHHRMPTVIHMHTYVLVSKETYVVPHTK